jgi:hypothetical protein
LISDHVDQHLRPRVVLLSLMLAVACATFVFLFMRRASKSAAHILALAGDVGMANEKQIR